MADEKDFREVGPPRDEQLSDEPLGRLPGDKPAPDTTMGAKPKLPPEAPTSDKMDESETITPQ